MQALMNSRFSTLLQQVCLCIAFALAATSYAEDLFPSPSELQPDINFWVKVYTEIDTSSGFIHDANDISVIYETVQLTGNYRGEKKQIRAALARHSVTLKHLASRPSQPLTAEQQRVQQLWGESVNSARLRKAADNVRFQRGQSNRFRQGLIRSGEWNSHINKVLADRGLPAELAILPHVESSFNPKAYSSAGAAGIWQFTRATGRRYMQVDYVVDERMDPFAATVAAAQLLKHNRQLTGTWPLALTAYNHGASSMRRATAQLGTTDITTILRDYKWRTFGFASRNFYLSFLAALEVSTNSQRYFAPFKSAGAVPYIEVKLPDYLLVDSFAKAFNTDIEVLKQHNRALLEPIWRKKKRIPQGFTMRVPSDHIAGTAEQLLAAIPARERFSEQTPDLFHTVVAGDTVSVIARRYGHKIRDVASMNGLNRRYQIRIGQVLKLPLEGSIVVAAASVDSSTSTGVSPPVIAPPAAIVSPASSVEADVVSSANTTAVALAATQPSGENLAGELTLGASALELLADPSDYTVAADQSIEVQGSETLGHYAEWLDVRASQLRRLSERQYGRPVVVGHRLKLDFSQIGPQEFERRRIAYQSELQQTFFSAWHIRSTHKHIIAQGESLWALTRQQYKVPMWLLRQYNPDLDPDRLHPGMVIVIPKLEKA